jgi:multidrug efflux system membrane fusion protein
VKRATVENDLQPDYCPIGFDMLNHTRALILVLLASCLPLAACSSSSGGGAAPAGGRAGGRGGGGPVPIVSTRVQQKPMPVTLSAVGSVETIASVQVHAQVTGQLGEVKFVEGQDVEKAQPLFSIDPRPFDAALQQAQAVLERDTATWQNAQAQQARLDSLFGRGLVSQDQYEAQRASAAALAATVAADKAAIDSARINLQLTRIAAPISGRTGSLGAHAGDLIRANDTAALVVINQLSPIYVAFSVPGLYLSKVRRYQGERSLQVSAVIPPGADQSATAAPGQAPAVITAQERGKVTFIDNAVDPTTGTIRLKATFANADRHLWPGAFVQVVLDLTTDPNALVVPAVAVQTSQDGQYVYVVKEDRTVEMRPVKVDRQQGDEMVIASGVSAGETVVTDGHLRLTPGARVVERGDAGADPGRAGGRAGRGAQGGQGRQGSR